MFGVVWVGRGGGVCVFFSRKGEVVVVAPSLLTTPSAAVPPLLFLLFRPPPTARHARARAAGAAARPETGRRGRGSGRRGRTPRGIPRARAGTTHCLPRRPPHCRLPRPRRRQLCRARASERAGGARGAARGPRNALGFWCFSRQQKMFHNAPSPRRAGCWGRTRARRRGGRTWRVWGAFFLAGRRRGQERSV